MITPQLVRLIILYLIDRIELMFLKLVTLDISLNRISVLPVELRFMVSLVDLCVEHNPLTSPPTHVIIDFLIHHYIGQLNFLNVLHSFVLEVEFTSSSSWNWKRSKKTESAESLKEATVEGCCQGNLQRYLMPVSLPTIRDANDTQSTVSPVTMSTLLSTNQLTMRHQRLLNRRLLHRLWQFPLSTDRICAGP